MSFEYKKHRRLDHSLAYFGPAKKISTWLNYNENSKELSMQRDQKNCEHFYNENSNPSKVAKVADRKGMPMRLTMWPKPLPNATIQLSLSAVA